MEVAGKRLGCLWGEPRFGLINGSVLILNLHIMVEYPEYIMIAWGE